MELITYLILRLILKDPKLTSEVFNSIYGVRVPKQKIKEPKKPVKTSQKVSNLRQALQELKSKPNKTKKDRESIGILEAVIKNGY
jgi:ribosomal protein S19E (S16A)